MVDKIKDIVCCLLATSAIMLSENKKRKRKMCSKNWYLERDTSYDVHLQNEFLEKNTKVKCLEIMSSWFQQVN
jgi:hypothetical protein